MSTKAIPLRENSAMYEGCDNRYGISQMLKGGLRIVESEWLCAGFMKPVCQYEVCLPSARI